MNQDADPNTDGAANPSSDAEKTPTVGYWHVYIDDTGTSRQKRRILKAFQKQSMGAAAPQWNDVLSHGAAKVMVSVLPVGWVGNWHENPQPQWIIPLSGQWYVETMDGQRVEMGPGDISFGEDQNCTADADGRKGHRSGTIGQMPAVLMLIQLDAPPSRNLPGHWR